MVISALTRGTEHAGAVALAGSNERRNHSSCEVTATPERNDYAHKLHLEGNGINSPAPLNEHGYLFLEPVSDDCPGEVLLVVN